MKKPIRIGVIGLGRWGINYFRTFSELKNCTVKYVCATKKKTLSEAIKKVKPIIMPKAVIDYNDLLNDKELDAVAIVTNGASHCKLAKEALEANKHVIVEKPLAFTSQDVKKLISISNKKDKILMVGHLHLYNPAIRKIKNDITRGLFGKINYIHSFGAGNGPVRNDMNVLWDFFPHDVSILLYLLDKFPLSVSANGACYIKNGVEDVVTMDIMFPKNIFATSIASWIYPLKKRDVVVVGKKLYAVFDDYAKKNKLGYYNKKVPTSIYAPKISSSKPLTEELRHFLDCIENDKTPLTDGNEALKVTRVLESAQKSLRNKGKRIKITK